MSSRPIIFSAPKVRALLDGRKTQTRLVIKPQPKPGSYRIPIYDPQGLVAFGHDASEVIEKCRAPYAPGDRLWVREAWHPLEYKTGDGETVVYRADEDEDGTIPYLISGTPTGGGVGHMRVDRWRPSIHMPRWASRITLTVTEVRVQRLQDISEADVLAEGGPPSHPSIDCVSREYGYPDFPRSWFAQLWDHLHGPGAWAANPCVVAVTFRARRGNIDKTRDQE